MTLQTRRLALLGDNLPMLKGILRGIEKEGLRVDSEGRLVQTAHPPALGAALTNNRITTDYSEALLELITGTHRCSEQLIRELEDTHRYTAQHLSGELIWNQSMPATLPAESDIPIAWYGTSNSGMLKHVYRRGLAVRYGKTMQCIAGVHYNFSLPDEIWTLFEIDSISDQDRRSKGYMDLIRNFMRYSWMLMYLFGASPAVSKNFMRGVEHSLQQFDEDTLFLPWATSLRMSDLGYQSTAQSELQLCYNDIDTFLARIYMAATTPWPAYTAIGTHRDGEWIQLNTNILQIENEYYSNIRPKRTTGRGERPSTALANRGVQYIEVRCLDIDPYSPTGISVLTSRFLDAYLLFCASEDSPFFPSSGYCKDSHENFSRVVKEGRKPGLQLVRQDKKVDLASWGKELLEAIMPYAELLDGAQGTTQHREAVDAQMAKIEDSSLTPSARLLHDMRAAGLNLHDFSLQLSQKHHEALRAEPLSPATEQEYERIVAASFKAQTQLEQSDVETFDAYAARYLAALTPP